jgi:ferritin-like metal-binding protein YciE
MWGTSPQFCKKALPKMAKQADSSELRRAFEHHLKETEGQVERLEQVFVLAKPAPPLKESSKRVRRT